MLYKCYANTVNILFYNLYLVLAQLFLSVTDCTAPKKQVSLVNIHKESCIEWWKTRYVLLNALILCMCA